MNFCSSTRTYTVTHKCVQTPLRCPWLFHLEGGKREVARVTAAPAGRRTPCSNFCFFVLLLHSKRLVFSHSTSNLSVRQSIYQTVRSGENRVSLSSGVHCVHNLHDAGYAQKCTNCLWQSSGCDQARVSFPSALKTYQRMSVH